MMNIYDYFKLSIVIVVIEYEMSVAQINCGLLVYAYFQHKWVHLHTYKKLDGQMKNKNNNSNKCNNRCSLWNQPYFGTKVNVNKV